GRVYLEIAWEPRFQPFLIETQPEGLVIQDDKGVPLAIPEGGKGQAPVAKRLAVTLDLRIPAPKRSSQRLGLLKGNLKATGPSEMLSFTFDKLAKITKAAEARKETKEGIAVHLRELQVDDSCGDQVWTVGVLLEYPVDGPKFESFQSWLVN